MDQTQEFIQAVTQGDQAKMDEMLRLNSELVSARNAGGTSAVLLSIYYGHPELACVFIERGARFDIFEAAAAGWLARVKELLRSEPESINQFGADGFQPLGLAAFFGHLETVRYLLLRGADVNSPSRNPQQVMPLHSSVAGKHYEISKLLLEHGADVNAVQADGFNPLHEAVQNEQEEMVRLILQYNPDLHARKADGQSALDIAIEKGNQPIQDLLSSSNGPANLSRSAG